MNVTLADVIREIKRKVWAGDNLEHDLEDVDINEIVNESIREIRRYFDETAKVTIPFQRCINLNEQKFKPSSIIKIYKVNGNSVNTDDINVNTDPLYAYQFLIWSNGGTMYNVQDYTYNYGAWSTMNQIRNTLTTELDFEEDKQNNLVYIFTSLNPKAITLEYIPRIEKVEDIQTDRWIDILIQLAVAHTKVEVGRIRTRYTTSNELWGDDAEKMLTEGQEELKALREKLEEEDSVIPPLN